MAGVLCLCFVTLLIIFIASLCSHTCWVNIIYFPSFLIGQVHLFLLYLCTLGLWSEIKHSERTALQIAIGNKVGFFFPSCYLSEPFTRAQATSLHFTGTEVEAQRREATWQRLQMRFSDSLDSFLVCGLVSWSLLRVVGNRDSDGRADCWSTLVLLN